MDKKLLKKAAVQSVILMLVVLTSSFALKQYHTVTIEAISKYSASGTDAQAATLDSSTDSQTGDDREGQVVGALSAPQKNFAGADPKVLKQLGADYLVINKPEGKQLALTLEDLYITKSIELNLSGLQSNELTSSMITRVRGDEVFSGDPAYTEKSTTETNEDGKEQQIITRDYGDDLSHGITITYKEEDSSGVYTADILMELNSVYAYTILEDSAYYYIKLQKPSEVYDKILVIDAGHGGKDNGASSRDGNYFEKNFNVEIVRELKKLLDNESIKVYYTRLGDDTVYLRPRQELANAVDCDYFISIHCNSSKVSYPNGSEVLYLNKEYKGIKNLDLAKLLSEELGNEIPLKDRGTVKVGKDDVYIMKKSQVPMALVEVGYISNYNDLNYFLKEDNQKAIARGIYNGIMKAYKELPVNKKIQE